MKQLNLFTKPIGMAVIAGTLLSINPLAIYSSGSQELASTELRRTITVRSSGEQHNLDVNVSAEAQTETVFENGEFVTRPKEGAPANFQARVVVPSSLGCTTNCVLTTSVSAEQVRTPEGLAAAIMPAVEQFRSQLEREERELAERRGNLEQRQKKAEQCQIQIVDENDKSKDIRLNGNDNRSERLACLADRFEEMDFDSERDEHRAFRRMFDRELKDIVMSDDAEAADALADLRDRLGSDDLVDYVDRLGAIHSNYQDVITSAETLANPNVSQAEQLQTQQSLLMMNQQYLQQPMGRSRGSIQAIMDYRTEMLDKIRIAMESPSSLVAGVAGISGDSIFTAERNRLNRQSLGTSIPRIPTVGSATGVGPAGVPMGQPIARPGQVQTGVIPRPMPGQMPNQFGPQPQYQPMPGQQQYQPMPGQPGPVATRPLRGRGI